MNDLMGAVKGSGSSTLRAQPPAPSNGAAPAPPGQPVPENPDKNQPEFLSQVDSIKSMLAAIREQLVKLQRTNEQSKTVSRGADMRSLRAIMQADINQVNKTALAVKARLEKLDADNATTLKQPGCGTGSSSERVRTQLTGALRKKLFEIMQEFQALRQRVQDEYREVVHRRVYTVTGQRPADAEVENLIETGESETIFQKAILERGRGQVADTVAEIHERHEAVKELEKSLLELHQIFMDMAVLVQEQGEQLDNIEQQVGRAVQYVQSGTSAMVEAKTYQKKTRKLQCCLLLTALIIIAIIAGIVAWQVTKK